MTTLAPTDISAVIEARVREISRGGEDVILAAVAEEIVTALAISDPEALIDWFRSHAVGLVREQLRTRLAVLRHGGRAGAFYEGRIYVKPFARRYAVEGHAWRQVGDMTRQDWGYIVQQRSLGIQAGLFDVALAKRVIARLPDETTRTRDVLTEAELSRLEREAEDHAARVSRELVSEPEV